MKTKYRLDIASSADKSQKRLHYNVHTETNIIIQYMQKVKN